MNSNASRVGREGEGERKGEGKGGGERGVREEEWKGWWKTGEIEIGIVALESIGRLNQDKGTINKEKIKASYNEMLQSFKYT